MVAAREAQVATHARGLLGEKSAYAHEKSSSEKAKCNFIRCNGTWKLRQKALVTTSGEMSHLVGKYEQMLTLLISEH